MRIEELREKVINTPLVELKEIEREYQLDCHIYAKLENENLTGSAKIRPVYYMIKKALEEGDDDLLASVMGNSLEEAAISLVPEIKQIKDTLKAAGFKLVLMSGSGSTVFALSTDALLVKRVARKLEDKYVVEVTKVIKK